MTTGLTLGKFAPLHKGHQALIESGINETDKFIVLIYDAPETTPVPLDTRAGWIRSIYPGVEVIMGWDGPTMIGDTPEIMRLQEDFILRVLGDRRIDRFYSSEFYGDHVSKALGAMDCRVDRFLIPVSGTGIRPDPFLMRHHLDPRVYRDLVTWSVFLGAPCTGKTTLCQTLAEQYRTVWMPEYGREYWEQHQRERRLSPEQLLEIATAHRNLEDELVQDAREHFFIDTDATTTCVFARYYHGAAPPDLEALADSAVRRYDLIFLCEDDIPCDDTWDRSGTGNRSMLQRRIKADLLRRRTPYISLRGTLEQRVATVARILERFDKWRSLSDCLIRD